MAGAAAESAAARSPSGSRSRCSTRLRSTRARCRSTRWRARGRVADEVIKPAKGFKVGTEETAGSGFDATTIMFEPNAEAEAEDLARTVSDQLGETR